MGEKRFYRRTILKLAGAGIVWFAGFSISTAGDDIVDWEEQGGLEADRPIQSSPAVVDGTVFAGSWNGNLYAMDAETGTEQWRFGTDDRVTSSP
ncbi:PGF-CTERM sorting domain-containing protein, partial [Natronobacterium gregoryi SP2]